MSKPIEVMGEGYPSFGDYGDVSIEMSHPLHDDPLVDIRDYNIAGESYYARTDGENVPYNAPIVGATKQIYVRQSVAEKLDRINERLAEDGLMLHVFDAYRPITCQQGIWDYFWAKYEPEFTDADGRVDTEALQKRVEQNVSNPKNFDSEDASTWPVHSTGGAVDLTLADADTGELVDMGTYFDDMSDKGETAYYEQKLLDGDIDEDDPYLRARRLLVEVMEDEGFRNHGAEWFHFGWGDQMSAKLNNQPSAFYGYVDPPAGCELVQSPDVHGPRGDDDFHIDFDEHRL